MSNKLFLWLLFPVVLFSVSGATCPRGFQAPPGPAAPTVFYGTPSLDQIIQVVNNNTARINQLQTTGATLSVTGVPPLQCDVAFERPMRLRLTAGTRITGNELDLGSNDNVFWFWARRNPDPAIYFARHAEFRSGAVAEILPVPPSWIIEALGLVQLTADESTSGPFPRGNGRLEIRSTSAGTQGDLTRLIVIDDQRGFVLEQSVYDAQGQLLATAAASDHQYDATFGVSLPRQIDIQLPPAQMAFSIKTSGYLINQLSAEGLQLWSMPEKDGHMLVDLARLQPSGLPSSPAPSAQHVPMPGPVGTWPSQPRTTVAGDGLTRQTATVPRSMGVYPTGRVIRQQSRRGRWW